jgi:hypothetical protein
MRIVTGITGSSGEWLLMVPPLTSGGDTDTSEPLSKWRNVGNFANQADCKNSMTTQQFAVHRYYRPIGNAQNYYEGDAVRTLHAPMRLYGGSTFGKVGAK